LRRLVRAAIAGGRFSCGRGCWARASAGVVAAAAAEVRRKRRRSILDGFIGVVIVAA
jgi:hypothetical protein